MPTPLKDLSTKLQHSNYCKQKILLEPKGQNKMLFVSYQFLSHSVQVRAVLAAVKAKHCGLNEEEMPKITFTLLVLTNFLLQLVKTHKKLVKISEFVQNSGESHQMLVLLVKIFGKSSTVDLASALILSFDEDQVLSMVKLNPIYFVFALNSNYEKMETAKKVPAKKLVWGIGDV